MLLGLDNFGPLRPVDGGLRLEPASVGGALSRHGGLGGAGGLTGREGVDFVPSNGKTLIIQQ